MMGPEVSSGVVGDGGGILGLRARGIPPHATSIIFWVLKTPHKGGEDYDGRVGDGKSRHRDLP